MVNRSGPGALLLGSFCISFFISTGEQDSVRSSVESVFDICVNWRSISCYKEKCV